MSLVGQWKSQRGLGAAFSSCSTKTIVVEYREQVSGPFHLSTSKDP